MVAIRPLNLGVIDLNNIVVAWNDLFSRFDDNNQSDDIIKRLGFTSTCRGGNVHIE